MQMGCGRRSCDDGETASVTKMLAPVILALLTIGGTWYVPYDHTYGPAATYRRERDYATWWPYQLYHRDPDELTPMECDELKRWSFFTASCRQ